MASLHTFHGGRAAALPPARMVRLGSVEVPQGPWHTRTFAERVAAARGGLVALAAHVWGLLPIVLVMALAGALVWGYALGHSP
jgi:hypothetical protein